MKKKSITINATANIINTVFKMLFPLITFPYISRALGVENIGKINYANSLISYFVLISGLGLAIYAIREGAKIRDNRDEFSKFASEIFSINILSTIIAYVFLIVILCIIPQLENYRVILLIYSTQIIFITFGMDWVNSVYEEFTYITIRSCLFQLISLILTFLLVKKQEDYYIYAIISVFSSVGANILNFFRIRAFCEIKVVYSSNLLVHIKPIMHIFYACIASAIYTSLDTTMLGIIKGEYAVGLYSAAIKVYNIIKQILFSLIAVFEPRLSYFATTKDNDCSYEQMLLNLFNLLVILVIPMLVGIICVSDDIISILAGSEYILSSDILKVLSISIIFSMLAYFTMHAILLPLGLEKYIGRATCTGAAVNIIFNYILINFYGGLGAALATVLAEFLVFIVAVYYGSRKQQILFSKKTIIYACLSSLIIILIAILGKLKFDNVIIRLTVIMCSSVSGYFLLLLLFKENTVSKVLNRFLNIVKKCKAYLIGNDYENLILFSRCLDNSIIIIYGNE